MPAEDSADSFLHFRCRFVGERNGQDAVGGDSRLDQFGNSQSDYPSLPGSRSSQYQQRPRQRIHCLVLGFIERFELEVGAHGVATLARAWMVGERDQMVTGREVGVEP